MPNSDATQLMEFLRSSSGSCKAVVPGRNWTVSLDGPGVSDPVWSGEYLSHITSYAEQPTWDITVGAVLQASRFSGSKL